MRLDLPRVAIATLLAGCLALPSAAESLFPAPDWRDQPNPVASPHAVVGGEISISAGPYPKSLNYYLDNNVLSAEVFFYLYETLLSTDPLTVDYRPGLAERWSISDDKRTFTFWINPQARWSDGRPVTAEDVKWTFDTIMSPTNLTGSHKVSLETFQSPEIPSNGVIRFTAKEVHWRNLGAVGGIGILPRHAFAGRDFNKINFEFPVVSGPYRLGEIKEGVSTKLVRREDWWARTLPRHRFTGNFKVLTYRFFDEQENAFEAFKKGMLDVYPVYTARLWVNESQGEKFDRNWIVKQKIQNYNPVGFQGFAMNMRRPPFDDVRVRSAMAHLLDREKMNRTLMYSQYFLHRSYYEDLYSKSAPCTNTLFDFDKQKARQLLAEAGWTVNPATGQLEKGGKPFAFRFLNRDTSSEKFLNIFAEDLKDVGIAMELDRKDWSAWAKDMETYNFEMTWAAWTSGLFKDPEGMWHSKEAGRPGGNNVTGFADPQVDELIDKQKTLFDLAARNEICRRIDAAVTRQVPYVLLWNINHVRLLYWNRFGTPPTVLGKYDDERGAYWLWWLDEDSAADLTDAMQNARGLPARKPVAVFDDEFKPAS